LLAPKTPGGFGPHALAAPCTPMPGRGQGLPPPSTPGGVQQGGAVNSSVNVPDRHQPDDDDWLPPLTMKRSASGSLQEPPSKKQVAAPQTPAGLGASATPQKFEAHPGARKQVAAPQTPAMLGTAQALVANPPLSSAPSTPPKAGPRAAPQTPAGLGEPIPSMPRSLPNGPPIATGGMPMPTPATGHPPPPKAGAGKLLSFSSVLTAASAGRAPTGAPPPQAAKVISSRQVFSAGGPPKPDKPKLDEPPLPPGWEKRVSKSNGKTYYWNAKHVKSQYDRPKA
jgi:hypothetical protein